MGINQRFKWVRAQGSGPAGSSPDFYSYNLKTMRQIPTLAGVATGNATATPIISAFIPASSWGTGKCLIIRGFYKFHIPAAGMPPTYNVTESVQIPNAATIVLPTPPAFIPLPGEYTTWIQRNIVRFDPNMHVTDLGDVMQHNWANLYDSSYHVIPVAPLIAPFDYSTPIQIDLQVTMPIAPAACTITCLWCEAFLEQATNLGKLP